VQVFIVSQHSLLLAVLSAGDEVVQAQGIDVDWCHSVNLKPLLLVASDSDVLAAAVMYLFLSAAA
jgi:hypothetical protein